MRICSVNDCTKPARTKGLCETHYMRLYRTGSVEKNSRRAPLAERFANRYRVELTGCWLWAGYLNNEGYGFIGAGGKQKHMLAHRASYQIHVGEIPEGMCVLHRCDTPACVNPKHLFLGTNADNTRDMWTKGRGVTPTTRGTNANPAHHH